MNALRFNYFLYIPILIIDFTVIGLMAWACTPKVQAETYQNGKRRVGPIVLLLCVSCMCSNGFTYDLFANYIYCLYRDSTER
jgi:hypothetical protein